MCYYTKNELKGEYGKRFKVQDVDLTYDPVEVVNAFSHPSMPIIARDSPDRIISAEWGLMPHWEKDRSRQKNTLNAKIETLHSLNSFKAAYNNRCMVLVDGFYEWKWEDPSNAKSKKYKHLITVPGGIPFALAGIYSDWQGIRTMAIVTTAADTLMTEIHNSKKRMPVVLRPDNERLWLEHEEAAAFALPEIELIATPV